MSCAWVVLAGETLGSQSTRVFRGLHLAQAVLLRHFGVDFEDLVLLQAGLIALFLRQLGGEGGIEAWIDDGVLEGLEVGLPGGLALAQRTRGFALVAIHAVLGHGFHHHRIGLVERPRFIVAGFVRIRIAGNPHLHRACREFGELPGGPVLVHGTDGIEIDDAADVGELALDFGEVLFGGHAAAGLVHGARVLGEYLHGSFGVARFALLINLLDGAVGVRPGVASSREGFENVEVHTLEPACDAAAHLRGAHLLLLLCGQLTHHIFGAPAFGPIPVDRGFELVLSAPLGIAVQVVDAGVVFVVVQTAKGAVVFVLETEAQRRPVEFVELGFNGGALDSGKAAQRGHEAVFIQENALEYIPAGQCHGVQALVELIVRDLVERVGDIGEGILHLLLVLSRAIGDRLADVSLLGSDGGVELGFFLQNGLLEHLGERLGIVTGGGGNGGSEAAEAFGLAFDQSVDIAEQSFRGFAGGALEFGRGSGDLQREAGNGLVDGAAGAFFPFTQFLALLGAPLREHRRDLRERAASCFAERYRAAGRGFFHGLGRACGGIAEDRHRRARGAGEIFGPAGAHVAHRIDRRAAHDGKARKGRGSLHREDLIAGGFRVARGFAGGFDLLVHGRIGLGFGIFDGFVAARFERFDGRLAHRSTVDRKPEGGDEAVDFLRDGVLFDNREMVDAGLHVGAPAFALELARVAHLVKEVRNGVALGFDFGVDLGIVVPGDRVDNGVLLLLAFQLVPGPIGGLADFGGAIGVELVKAADQLGADGRQLAGRGCCCCIHLPAREQPGPVNLPARGEGADIDGLESIASGILESRTVGGEDRHFGLEGRHESIVDADERGGGSLLETADRLCGFIERVLVVTAGVRNEPPVAGLRLPGSGFRIEAGRRFRIGWRQAKVEDVRRGEERLHVGRGEEGVAGGAPFGHQVRHGLVVGHQRGGIGRWAGFGLGRAIGLRADGALRRHLPRRALGRSLFRFPFHLGMPLAGFARHSPLRGFVPVLLLHPAGGFGTEGRVGGVLQGRMRQRWNRAGPWSGALPGDALGLRPGRRSGRLGLSVVVALGRILHLARSHHPLKPPLRRFFRNRRPGPSRRFARRIAG